MQEEAATLIAGLVFKPDPLSMRGAMDSTQTGLAGEFYVLAQLMQHGLVATLTLGNTKGVDILVSNPDLNRLYKVEVKTGNRRPAREKFFSDEFCHA
jgi:hypothetical protein